MQVCSKVFYGKLRVLTVQLNSVQATSGLVDTVLMETTVSVESFLAKARKYEILQSAYSIFP